MATPRKRPSSGFSEKNVAKEETEEKELGEFLKETTEEILEEVEKQEETKEESKLEAIREITPTEDPGPRFVEQPAGNPEPSAKPIELNKPKRHPRNIPRFTRIAK